MRHRKISAKISARLLALASNFHEPVTRNRALPQQGKGPLPDHRGGGSAVEKRKSRNSKIEELLESLILRTLGLVNRFFVSKWFLKP